MESRVERYKILKNGKKHRRFKIMIFIVCLLSFFTILYRVDKTLREIMCISDKCICAFKIEHESYRLHLLGADYVINKEQIVYYLDNIHNHTQQIFRMLNDFKNKLLNK